MTYIYDILVNFSEYLYDFYEWNKKDNILHIKKIPVLKVDGETMNDFYHYHVKVEKDIIEKIELQTEKYDFKKVEYAAIFSDGDKVLALEFNKGGQVKYRSRLLLDDEEELLGFIKKSEVVKIEYQKEGRRENIPFLTRKEARIQSLLLKNIEVSYKKKQYQKIEYLYLECFGKKKKEIDIMYQELCNSIRLSFSNVHLNLYQILLLEPKKA